MQLAAVIHSFAGTGHAQPDSPPAHIAHPFGYGLARAVTRPAAQRTAAGRSWQMGSSVRKHARSFPQISTGHYVIIPLVRQLGHKRCFIKFLLICCFIISSWLVGWYPPTRRVCTHTHSHARSHWRWCFESNGNVFCE